MRRTISFTCVNILGLAVGLAGFVLILLYLNYEKSYDTWHEDLALVHKVAMESEEGILWDGRVQAPLASFLKQSYPKVQEATRISSNGSSDNEFLVDANGKKIYQKGNIEVDSLFFAVFPYQFVYGDRNNALKSPDAIVLEESVAKAYFGQSDPIGQTISIYGGRIVGKVTGVIKQPSTPSLLNARVLMRSPYEKSNNHWQNFSFETYIKVARPVDGKVLAAEINAVYETRLNADEKNSGKNESEKNDSRYFTEKFTELHTNPRSGGSKLPTINIMLALAASLLIAGAINFSNLSLADAFRRAKEVGVKKVLGASRSRLFAQLVIDVSLQVVMALVIAGLLVYAILPSFRNEFGIDISIMALGNTFYAQLLICLLVTIAVAAVYPALMLSNLSPVKVLKGKFSLPKQGFNFRNGLTILQFVISCFFIIVSLVIYRQVKFMHSKDKGFSDEQVLRIQTTQLTREQNFEKARQMLLSLPGVTEVAKTTTVPGDAMIDTSSVAMQWKGAVVRMNEVKVSREYFGLIGAQLSQGRWFDGRYMDEHTRSVIINEAAARRMAMANPIGEIIRFPHCDTVPVQIVGVVKDFNVQGLNLPVQPAMFNIGNFTCGYRSGGAILVKIQTQHTQATLAAIEKAWTKIEPEFPIRYSFLNDNFSKLYAEYRRIQTVVGFFAVVAIVISVIGLFAMSVFMVRERTKELGIRKVLGANAKDIFKITSRKFVFQSALGIIIALPLGWTAANGWLEDFAYRIELTPSIFFVSSLLLIGITLLTVSFQSVKAIFSNPVDALRAE